MDDAGEGSGGPTPPQPGGRRSLASLEGDYAASSAGTAGEAVPERLPPGAYLRGGRDAKEAAKAKAAASSPGSISGAGGEEGSRPGAYSVEGPDGAAAAASSAAPTAAAAREPLGQSLVEVTHAILVEDVPPHPLRAEAGYPDGGAEAPAVLLDAEVVPAEEAKMGGTGGEPGFSLRSRRVQLCLTVVVVAILGLAFGLGMSLGRGGGKATQATGAGAGAGVAATPPAPSAEQTGEEACEERGYGIQECLSVGCCEWDDGECFSAVEDGPCAAAPAGAEAERTRPNGLDFSFSLSYSMSFSFDLSYLGSASYDWGSASYDWGSLSFYSQSVQERRRGRRRLDRGGARRNRKKHSREFVEKASRSLRSIPLDDGPVPSLPEDR